MLYTKDTFYIALRSRLAALNPQRTVTILGVSRPAVVVGEDEPITSAPPLSECFYLVFGAVQPAKGTESSRRPVHSLACNIEYRTAGTAANLGVDRGRVLAQLDMELLQICAPPYAPKQDYSQTPPAPLNTQIFWDRPELGDIQFAGDELRRIAKTTIYFFPEMDLP
jgi:hypothetical protein